MSTKWKIKHTMNTGTTNMIKLLFNLEQRQISFESIKQRYISKQKLKVKTYYLSKKNRKKWDLL